MGNGNGKIVVEAKPKVYKTVNLHIPYAQLAMIRVLQREFDYEVKGTIYVDASYEFKSFEVRTDSSEIYSYGASDWRLSFHTHPDNTAQKYGIRYFSPPSVDDVMEVYEYCEHFVPESARTGELSIIFCNEGLYLLRADRDKFARFNKDNLPLEALEEVLKQTFTEFLVTEMKGGLAAAVNGRSINTVSMGKAGKGDIPVNIQQPQVSAEEFETILKRVARKTSVDFGFDMSYWSWPELERSGLTVPVSTYFLNKKVED